MNNTYETMIRIMKSFIYDKAFCLSEEISWKEIYKYARVNGISGIIGNVLNEHYAETVDENVLNAFKKAALSDYSKMALRYEQARLISDRLAENGIDHVVFKGYIVREYYPVKELRTFGDVDLLIRPDDRQKSDQLMQRYGYSVKEDWEPSFSYKKGLSYIEIHTDLLDTDISNNFDVRRFYKDKTLDNLVKIKEHVYEFNKEFHLVFLITHIAKHCSGSGAGIKMYLDLALMIKNEKDLDWKMIEQYIRETGMWRLSCHVFALIKRCFEIEIPMNIDEVSSDDLEMFIDYTFEAGTFGTYQRNTGAQELSRNNSGKIRILMEKVFPSRSTLSKRYTYLNKYPVLLPVAWIHRIILNSSSIRKRIDNSKKIMTADEKEISRFRQINEMLGL